MTDDEAFDWLNHLRNELYRLTCAKPQVAGLLTTASALILQALLKLTEGDKS